LRLWAGVRGSFDKSIMSKIRVSATISTFTLFIMVATLAKRGKGHLNLKFLGLVKGSMDDGKHN